MGGNKRKRDGDDGDSLVVKKMVLVPPDKVVPEYRLKRKAYRAPFQPNRNKLAELDEELQEILKEKPTSVNGYDRVTKYQDTLDKFLKTFQKIRHQLRLRPKSTPPPPHRPASSSSAPADGQEEEDGGRPVVEKRHAQRQRRLEFLGVTDKTGAQFRRANQLLDRLEDAGLKWHERTGQVVYPGGHRDSGEHIADLIHDVIGSHHGSKARKPSESQARFYRFMRRANVPKMVIGTKARRDYYSDPARLQEETEEEEEEEEVVTSEEEAEDSDDEQRAKAAALLSRQAFEGAVQDLYGEEDYDDDGAGFHQMFDSDDTSDSQV